MSSTVAPLPAKPVLDVAKFAPAISARPFRPIPADGHVGPTYLGEQVILQ
jgi:hypothetical protein